MPSGTRGLNSVSSGWDSALDFHECDLDERDSAGEDLQYLAFGVWLKRRWRVRLGGLCRLAYWRLGRQFRFPSPSRGCRLLEVGCKLDVWGK